MHWAVVLAGGSGTRFWPLSTLARPKQLLPLAAGGESTAEATVRRLEGLVPLERVLVVTGPQLAHPLREALGLPAENVLVEPRAASTAPALAWAAHEAHHRDSDATLLSLHADWYVPDAAAFRVAARAALDAAVSRRGLVTVGLQPSRPETGYGYIVPEAGPAESVRRVARFTEKPERAVAEDLIASGALWNSGLFAWRADTLRAELERHTPEIAPYLPLLDTADVAGFFHRVQPASIDVGLLERSAQVWVVAGEFAWEDIGTWNALRRVRPGDPQGNVVVGSASLIDSEQCIVWSEDTPVVVSGLQNVVVVAANGRVLVMARERAGDLKTTLEKLPPDIREVR